MGNSTYSFAILLVSNKSTNILAAKKTPNKNKHERKMEWTFKHTQKKLNIGTEKD